MDVHCHRNLEEPRSYLYNFPQVLLDADLYSCKIVG
jgi:hypothetical protein